MYSMAVSRFDNGGSVERQRSLRNRQCSVYASRIRPSVSPIAVHGSDPQAAVQLPPLPVSPRWDSLSNGSHLILSSPTSTDEGWSEQPQVAAESSSASSAASTSSSSSTSLAERRGNAPPDVLLKTNYNDNKTKVDVRSPHEVENFSRPRKQSLRQPTEQSAPVPRLLANVFARARNGYGPPLTAAARAPLASSSSPMAVGGAPPPPWMAGDGRSSFRSQLTESSAFGTAVTERSSVLTKNSSVTSLYTDEPSLEDVMCMYEKGFADDDDDDDDDENEDDEDDDDDDDDLDIDGDSDTNRQVIVNSVVTVASDPSDSATSIADLPRPATAMSAPAEGRNVDDGYLAPPVPPTTRSALDAEIRQSKMLFTSPAFTASVPALSAAADLDVAEKRDSAKSLDSVPSMSSSDRMPPAEAKISPLPPSPTSLFRAAMEPEDPGSRDRYGFKKQNQSITREQYDAWNKDYTQYLARRHKKWVAYLAECGLMTDRPIRFPPPSAKTKRFVRKGIPPDWRGAAWFYYAGGPAILARHSGLYEKLLEREAKPVDVEAIERDLHRTFPDNIQFQSSPPSCPPDHSNGPSTDEPPIVSSLRRVLHAFAVYNPRIGYCQSLNFLAGLLLLFVETEEQCFWLLNVITIIYLPGTHEMSLEGSKVDLGVLMTELRDTMPAVWDKIGGELEAGSRAAAGGKAARKARPTLWRRDQPRLSTERLPPITLCMTAWFMSCYIGTLPMETTLRVWDVFFYEGSKTLFRIALAIFKSGEAEIKAVSDPMEMFGVVQALPRRMLDANGLMETCFKRRNGFGHLSQDAIDERRQERRDKAHQDRTAATPEAEEPAGGTRRKGTLFGRRRREASRTRAE
ncbi:hypothetical protein L249_8720 [Ophiocordyceps polyrhachis-furcata BCC 54312]|uniref:Rab-GAP TBC domain-containing protein n=1 Tax=Ophiocordyceps polyrhachis-furcata BCC 54312 TaxID=1330021 RepID=A0A367L719_9HYPO|nr:hypothetical protein L249_8720 [Ophiocordyceps polyrhachis-furcata BCC 54312]